MNRNVITLGLIAIALFVGADPAYAAEEGGAGIGALGAGLAVGIAALGCGLGQGKAVGSALDSIGRNPGAAGQIFTPMILGLVFMETLTILALVVAFLKY